VGKLQNYNRVINKNKNKRKKEKRTKVIVIINVLPFVKVNTECTLRPLTKKIKFLFCIKYSHMNLITDLRELPCHAPLVHFCSYSIKFRFGEKVRERVRKIYYFNDVKCAKGWPTPTLHPLMHRVNKIYEK